MSHTRKLRWAMIGTKEWLSDQVAEAIKTTEEAELVAIADRKPSKASDFAKKHGIPKSYTDLQQVLSDPDIDVVYICLPNYLHKEAIIRCAEAGKRILCEKPMVLTRKEAEEIIAVLKKKGVYCMEGLMYLCHPFIQKLKELVDSKIIGEMNSLSAVYTFNIAEKENEISRGAIGSLGCYLASLVRLLVNEEPTRIVSLGNLDFSRKHDTNSTAILGFKSGLIATITTADDIQQCCQFTIIGTKGSIKVTTNPWLPGNNNQIILTLGEKEEILNFKADKSLFEYEIGCVTEQIRSGLTSPQAPCVTLEHSIGNAAVLEEWLAQVKKDHSPSLTKTNLFPQQDVSTSNTNSIAELKTALLDGFVKSETNLKNVM